MHRLDEGADRGEEGFALAPWGALAQVQRIVPQLRIVRAHVEYHRQGSLWMDASAGHIKRQLADGDAHAVAAQVPQAEDTAAVRDHHDVYLGLADQDIDIGHDAMMGWRIILFGSRYAL